MKITIDHKLPTAETFRALRSGVSWGVPALENAQNALDASLSGVVASHNGEIIGMARTIGDGDLNIYIQDVIVAKAYRHQGIGQKLVSALLDNIMQTSSPDCLIGLFAAEGQDTFYTRFGFKARPHLGFGPGMHVTVSDLAKSRGAA